jgi:hypothetical protein
VAVEQVELLALRGQTAATQRFTRLLQPVAVVAEATELPMAQMVVLAAA